MAASSENSNFYVRNFCELRFLGEGSYGHVSLVQSRTDGLLYAVKRIPLENEGFGLREARIMARVKHPNIVAYTMSWIQDSFTGTQGIEATKEIPEFDFDCSWDGLNEYSGNETQSRGSSGGESCEDDSSEIESSEDTRCLYIMEEACKGSLGSLLEEKFDLVRISSVMKDMLKGVAHIHSKGYMHRDLSLGNVLIGTDGHAKIADFGLSMEEGAVCYDSDSTFGKTFYLPPEGRTSKMSDIYMLGMVFFELFVGGRSTDMERTGILQKFKETREWPGDVSTVYATIILRMVSEEPNDRPPALLILADLNSQSGAGGGGCGGGGDGGGC